VLDLPRLFDLAVGRAHADFLSSLWSSGASSSLVSIFSCGGSEGRGGLCLGPKPMSERRRRTGSVLKVEMPEEASRRLGLTGFGEGGRETADVSVLGVSGE
jgi:hypothetical protein